MPTKNFYFYAFGLIGLICLIGFGIDVMDIDAAQYASMSREMLNTGNYLHLYDVGADYLDKPPFLFWISSLSMKIFGVNNFGYRLPSFLFSILAVISTYRFSKLFYDRQKSLLSALILASCQGFFLMNHDVRTDTILMGCVAFSVWQIAEWFQKNSFKHLILGATGIAIGMMTKGPIALIIPAFAFGSQLILQRNISLLLKWQYIPAILLIAILLIPMSYGLYTQFDLHPEVTVNGSKNVSGLRFFYWTQSFGRITGESSWNNNANIFFLLQNMLWSFLPWIILFLFGLAYQIKHLFSNRFRIPKTAEAISLGGFILTYLALGMSKYQLPHYIFAGFPFAAIITARFVNDLMTKTDFGKLNSILLSVHFFIFSLIWIALILLMSLCFDSISFVYSILSAIFFIGFLYLFIRNRFKNNIILLGLYTIIGVNFFLNNSFYPALLKYQAGSNAGRYIANNNIPTNKTFTYKYIMWRSLHFYAHDIIKSKDSLNAINRGDYLITNKDGLKEIENAGIRYETVHTGPDYPVTKISLSFLNPETRNNNMNYFTLIKVK